MEKLDNQDQTQAQNLKGYDHLWWKEQEIDSTHVYTSIHHDYASHFLNLQPKLNHHPHIKSRCEK